MGASTPSRGTTSRSGSASGAAIRAGVSATYVTTAGTGTEDGVEVAPSGGGDERLPATRRAPPAASSPPPTTAAGSSRRRRARRAAAGRRAASPDGWRSGDTAGSCLRSPAGWPSPPQREDHLLRASLAVARPRLLPADRSALPRFTLTAGTPFPVALVRRARKRRRTSRLRYVT